MSNNLVEVLNEFMSVGYTKDTRTILMRNLINERMTPSYQCRVYPHWAKHDWKYYYVHTKPTYKRNGASVAKMRAMADKYKSTQIADVDSEAFTSVMGYLRHLYNEGEFQMREVEPALLFIRERADDGEWHMLDIRELHPLRDTPLTTELHDAFSTFNVRAKYMTVLHHLHVSEEVPSAVAYYPTLRAWRENKAVRTSMGKYLTKYMDLYCLNESQVKSMAEKHQANINASAGWTLKYIEHNDPDGWERVYNSEDVRSCMRGMGAVRVYAHEKSVLRLSYLEDSENKIIARCIVRDGDDSDKGWLRVYPDHNGNSQGRFLLDAIRADGYQKQTNLDGVLLRAVESSRGGGYVCPYLDSGDGGTQYVDVVTRDGVTYLLAGEGDYDASCTDGYVGESCSCDCCGEAYSEDYMTWIDSAEQRLCDYCRDENYTYAYGRRYEEYYRNEDCIEVNGTWYLMETADNHDIYQCEETDEWFHSDDMCFFDEGTVCRDVAVEVDHEHDGSDIIHPRRVHTLSDGTTCHDDDAEYYQAEIDELNEQGE